MLFSLLNLKIIGIVQRVVNYAIPLLNIPETQIGTKNLI